MLESNVYTENITLLQNEQMFSFFQNFFQVFGAVNAAVKTIENVKFYDKRAFSY